MPSFAAPRQRVLRLFSVSTLLLLLAGCSLTQIAPVQIGRIQQSETFTQKFTFLDSAAARENDGNLSEGQLFAQTRRMDRVFSQMLGDQNWQKLKDLYGLGNLRKELLDQEIYIRGFSQMTIYPDPFDGRYFSVDGSGRYFLIRKKSEAILLTGDFSFSDQSLSVADLQKGYVVLDINLFLIKIPGQLTYYHEAPIKYKIYIDNSLGEHGIYSIDYNKIHLSFLATTGEELSEANAYATITFDAPKRPTKLWDFRGIQFMRRDYEQLMRQP